MCIQEYSESCILDIYRTTLNEAFNFADVTCKVPYCVSHMLNVRMKKTYPKLFGHGYIFAQ
jgi:hypothetical protein